MRVIVSGICADDHAAEQSVKVGDPRAKRRGGRCDFRESAAAAVIAAVVAAAAAPATAAAAPDDDQQNDEPAAVPAATATVITAHIGTSYEIEM